MFLEAILKSLLTVKSDTGFSVRLLISLQETALIGLHALQAYQTILVRDITLNKWQSLEKITLSCLILSKVWMLAFREFFLTSKSWSLAKRTARQRNNSRIKLENLKLSPIQRKTYATHSKRLYLQCSLKQLKEQWLIAIQKKFCLLEESDVMLDFRR